NCVANSRILGDGRVDQLWIEPAAGDAGGALGVALSLWHRYLGNPRISPEASGTWERPRPGFRESSQASAPKSPVPYPPKYAEGMAGSFLGPRYSAEEIERFIDSVGGRAERFEEASLANEVARLLAQQNVVGLFQGRMEFGPRALGNRSILGDPRSPTMQS